MKGEKISSNRLSHTVWECKYHIVWIRSIGGRLFDGKLSKEIMYILRRLCEYKGIEIVEGKGCIDHIHMCLSIPPKHSVSNSWLSKREKHNDYF